MAYVLHRKCERDDCDERRAPVGNLCAAHRAADPPRDWHRWEGGADRLCARCKERKPLSEFRMQRGRLRSYCKPCGNAVNQEYRARHHEELLARRRAKYQPIRNGVYLHRRQAWAEGGQ